MILLALATYCDQLRASGVLPEPGWSLRRVKYFLELSVDGSLTNVVLASSDKQGRDIKIPEQVKRASGIAANFLCDTSSYLLGVVDGKDEKEEAKQEKRRERAKKCFEASRALHHEVLDGVESMAARAILSFFDSWDPAEATSCDVIKAAGDELLAGSMLTFVIVDDSGSLALAADDSDIRKAWDRKLAQSSSDDPVMTCLVTGEHGPIARLHPSIKGVMGAQSSGATLVGFNAPAFESYGHAIDQGSGQGRNAPVGIRVVQAYGAALNYLLSQPNHRVRLGDTTVVFWSERSDRGNSDLLSCLMGGMPSNVSEPNEVDGLISSVMEALSHGHPIAEEGIDLSSRFYVLGLAPNASRLSVRFFLQDSFGEMLVHVREHYERIKVVHRTGRENLTPFFLLRAIENENAKKPTVSSAISGGLLRAILEGDRYPEALFENALLRIRASHDVPYELAAILKAYLLRNKGYSRKEITVNLNEQSEDRAYSLGRAFAILEEIQRRANGTKTIASRYLDAASTTPSLVFPTVLKLANAHLAKIERDPATSGLASYFSRTLAELLGKGGGPRSFPRRFSLDEQGSFFLGYYAQRLQPARSGVKSDQQDSPVAVDSQEE